MTEDAIKTMFETVHTIAVVGCSTNETKDAHRIPAFIQRMGYRIIPINPFADEILGETAYPDLAAAAQALDEPIEAVDVFRPADDVPPIAQQAVEIEADVLWLQLGIRHEEAARQAQQAGLMVVQDACLLVEYQKRFGQTPRKTAAQS